MELLLALYIVHVLLWMRPCLRSTAPCASMVMMWIDVGTEKLMPTTLNTIDL